VAELARACAERLPSRVGGTSMPEEMALFLSLFRGTVNPSSATIQSSILPIPCKTLSPSPLPCYPLPCTPNSIPAPSLTRTWPPFRPALPNLLTFQRSNVPTIFDLTPSKPPHPNPLLSCQQTASVNPLFATLTKLPASVANKRLTEGLTLLDATLTKNRGVGATAFPRFNHSARSAGNAGPQILNRRPRFPHPS
jgi:hypothetical protein